jgi:hypothetical protein
MNILFIKAGDPIMFFFRINGMQEARGKDSSRFFSVSHRVYSGLSLAGK